MNTKTLFRPVGLKEMELILDTQSTQFPPRLEWQPIFYPVLNEAYAAQIANDWNTKDAFSGYCGFVTQFEVDATYLSKFKVENVGGAMHNELWVPSEELAEFNQHIVKPIQLIDAFYGEKYVGMVENVSTFKGSNALQQLEKVQAVLEAQKALQKLMKSERNAFLVNVRFWLKNGLTQENLVKLKGTWVEVFEDIWLHL